MKLIFPCLLLFLIAAISSCKKEGATDPVITLKSCTSTVINAKVVTCCLDSVLNDSRCPSDVVCIWAGTAVANFTLQVENNTYHFTLATLAMPNLFSKDTVIAGYTIRFKNLSPYPKFSAPQPTPAEYKAELEIH